MHAQQIQVNGATIHMVEKGAGDECLVFIHSLGSSIRSWEGCIEELSKDYQVMAIDIPGHGDSPNPTKLHTIRDYASEVIGIAQQYVKKPIYVVGNSIGGVIAVEAAYQNPEYIKGIAIVGCPAWKDEPERRDWLHHRSSTLLEPSGVPKLVTIDDVHQSFGVKDEKIQALLHEDRQKAGISVLAAMFALYSYDINEALEGIQVPVCSIYGSRDHLKYCEEVIKNKVKHVIAYEVVGGSHQTPIDKPSEVSMYVKQFIQQVSQ